MYRKKLFAFFLALLLLLAFAITACRENSGVPVAEVVERVVTVEVPGETVRVEVEVTRMVEVEKWIEPAVAVVPFEEQWLSSAHADTSAVAFTYWDNSDDKEIPVSCAKCHSTDGFLDFLGLDGSEAGLVSSAAPIGSVVSCEACHNDATVQKTSVVFPSGSEISGLGAESRCMECHQGRTSTIQVNASIERVGLSEGDEDTVNAELGFTNVHYLPAAATQFGSLAKGGFEYAGLPYDPRFEHVAPYQTCTDCHNSHTLEVKVAECATCHTDVRDREDLKNIRMEASMVDYDGDGRITGGIKAEIEGLQNSLKQAMQAYAREVSGTPIIYASHQHPYFFIDSNDNGELDEGEAVRANLYNAFTPRLAQAAYNYQFSKKDPGNYAHGGKYVIQLLYDSIADLNTALSEPIDLSRAHRDDPGHFAASHVAFRNWDASGVVPATCSKCHTAAGLPFFLGEGVAVRQAPSSGLNCATCHNDVSTFTLYEQADVAFPSGLRLNTGDPGSNLCLNCHQGRESTVSVNRLIGTMADDEVSESLRFLNIHYSPAAASLFGSEARGAYEYAGQTYLGRFEHMPAFDTCTECHTTHTLEVKVDACAQCHQEVSSSETLREIRINEVDYDGDGDATTGLSYEIKHMHGLLYEAVQDYAANVAGTPIVYGGRHPYFFIDTNGNGVADANEINADNRYVTWTPRLLRAAYNYQYVKKDAGIYAHNGLYAVQLLYDALTDLGVDTSGMVRPSTE
jgi:hypothetical protein